MRRTREEKRPEIYLDETWTNSHTAPERIWVDRDGCGGWRHPSGKGERLIIIDAGSATGWIPNAGKHFRSKQKSLDYHDEMNAAHFLEWFEYCLIPDLPPHSLKILDNAKYHNTIVEKIPTKRSTKRVMKQWLDNHGITYDSKDLKKDLFKLIQSCNAITFYQTDCVAARYGHEVVRLPIAHCEFNPIEMAWSIVKDYIRKNNTTFKLTDVQALIPLVFGGSANT